MVVERNIGIIGDGATDRKIFIKLIESILFNNPIPVNYIELSRKQIRDSIDRYWREASKNNTYYLPAAHAVQLQNEVVNVIKNAFSDFENELGIGQQVSHHDIILLTSDSERHLSSSQDYFQEWSFSLSKLITGAIERFYHVQIQQGYQRQYLPMIISLVAFPSTDILVAVAKGEVDVYNKKAPQLKQLVYGTTELRALSAEDLDNKALNFIMPACINDLFKKVPESRPFIQILSLLSATLVDNREH
jgi:hypothetical protein